MSSPLSAALIAVARPEAVLLADAPRTMGSVYDELDVAQQRRHDAFLCAQDQFEFVAARLLAVQVLNSVGVPVGVGALRQVCSRCAGPHGRPVVDGHDQVAVSWAHARGVVMAGVAPWPIGVDVERIDQAVPELVRDVCPVEGSAAGLAVWTQWTRAEALTKLTGLPFDRVLAWPLGGVPHPGGASLDLTKCQASVAARGVSSVTVADVTNTSGVAVHSPRDAAVGQVPWLASVAVAHRVHVTGAPGWGAVEVWQLGTEP